MDYCAPRGIPHSVFLGRVVGPGDPQWLPDDREKALWWMVHESERCPTCGHRPADFDPAEGGDPHAYEWAAVHCRGCEITAQGEDWLSARQKRQEVRRGTTIRLRPTAHAGEGSA